MADDIPAHASGATELIEVWPDGVPDPAQGTTEEAVFRQPAGGGPDLDWLRNVSRPTLTVVRPHPDRAKGAGVIVCPGGGWRILAWRHEGMEVADWFAARGVTAFVLKYRLRPTPDDPDDFARLNAQAQGREAELGRVSGKDAPRSLRELARDEAYARARVASSADARQALATVRARAEAFGLEPGRIGMIGFSAGAFLTVDVAMRPAGQPLAFAAAIYGGETEGAPVPADAPPLFACIAQDDRMLFRVVEGLYADWCDADRPAELHIFQKGGHGFGTVRQHRPVDQWRALLEAWLADLGYMPARGRAERAVEAS